LYSIDVMAVGFGILLARSLRLPMLKELPCRRRREEDDGSVVVR